MRFGLLKVSVLVFVSIMLMAASCGGPIEPKPTPSSLKDPGNFQAQVTGETKIDLSWTAVSDATGYSLERKVEGGSYIVLAASLPKSPVTYSDTTGETGKSYIYRIKTLRNAEKSQGVESNKVTLPVPGTPVNLTDLEPMWLSRQARNGNPSQETLASANVTESGTNLSFAGSGEALYSVAGLCTKFSTSVSGPGTFKVFADETQLWSGSSGSTGDLFLVGKQTLALVFTGAGTATWTAPVVTCSSRPNAPTSAFIGGKWGQVFKWGTSSTGLVATHAANLPDGRVISFSAWKELAFGLQGDTYIDRTDGYVWNPGKGVTPNISQSSFTQADAGDDTQTTDNPVDHDMFCAGLAMLPDGRLFAGGGGSFANGQAAISQFKTSYFDFRTSGWSAGTDDNMKVEHWYGTAVALPDNRLFIVGGAGSGDSATNPKFSRSAELLNTPGTGTWDRLDGPNDNVTLLFPLINSSGRSNEIDIESQFDEQEGWEFSEVRGWYPYLNVAPNGTLFQSGPIPRLNSISVGTNTVSVSPTGINIPASHAQMRTWGNYVMYDEGKILVTGGSVVRGHDATNTAMIMDVNGGGVNVQTVPNMRFRRSFQNSVVLPTGDVLIIGGTNSGKQMLDGVNGLSSPAGANNPQAEPHTGNPADAKRRWASDMAVTETVYTPEVYSPDKNTWRDLTDMTVPRNYHSVALLLEDGRVLAAGGGLCGDFGSNTNGVGCPTNHPNGQIYEPSYLFNPDGSLANRPAIGSLSVSNNAEGYPRVGYGQSVTITMTGLGDGSEISKFSVVKLSSVTHGINTDLRYLEFSKAKNNLSGSGNSYQLTTTGGPNARNILTPGYYFLFAVNDKGVPSVAKTIQVLQ
jgi:hypothetical protein